MNLRSVLQFIMNTAEGWQKGCTSTGNVTLSEGKSCFHSITSAPNVNIIRRQLRMVSVYRQSLKLPSKKAVRRCREFYFFPMCMLGKNQSETIPDYFWVLLLSLFFFQMRLSQSFKYGSICLILPLSIDLWLFLQGLKNTLLRDEAFHVIKPTQILSESVSCFPLSWFAFHHAKDKIKTQNHENSILL